ncbi:MAG: 1-deoxy-D-xylulose-5-phosphate reductoisomerase [Anaerorhabdus sp.]
MKRVVILGVTGSIGVQSIDVISHHLDQFELVGVSAGKNIEQLKKILKEVSVRYVCTMEKQDELEKEYPEIIFFHGDEGLLALVQIEGYDVLVNALVGFSGLKPTLKAIENKKDIALANKETLVVAGKQVMEAVKNHKVRMTPIDSEHSAIFQCLQQAKENEVNRLIITASGGSFRDKSRDKLSQVTVDEALAHPNWSMGSKITIDSATMMNKGFEVIEAHWLYGVPFNQIEVVLHPQSIVHSMVEFIDYSILAQLGNSDMRIPIQYALSAPDRIKINGAKPLDFSEMIQLDFKKMDMERFPLLDLAYKVGKKQGSLPAVLNAANEVANKSFLEGKIKFLDIEELVLDACDKMPYQKEIEIEDIERIDTMTREYVESKIRGKKWL